MIKAYIFDMDGVIIDSEPIHTEAKIAVLKEYGIKITPKALEAYIGRASREFFKDMVLLQNNPNVTWEEIAEKKHAMYDEIIRNDDTMQPINGLVELLQRIKTAGYAMAIGSSSTQDMINLVVDKFHIRDYFQVMVSGDELPFSKPDPAVYNITAQELGVEPEECIVIEDACAGVKAAKAAGMYCIAIRNQNSGQQDLSLADEIINSYDEITV